MDCRRPRLLDLYCCAGGGARGYQRAGFHVTGVDIKPQPRYAGDVFIHGEALDYVARHGRAFDAIHASPPCQAYSICRNNGSHKDAPKLIDETRRQLDRSGRPYVIENVATAPIENLPIFGIHAVILCGASFGLGVNGFELSRHRWFEANWPIRGLPCKHTRGKTIGVYGNGTNSFHRAKFGRCITAEEFRAAMGIGWMNRHELNQAIPPVYTEFIGRQLIERI